MSKFGKLVQPLVVLWVLLLSCVTLPGMASENPYAMVQRVADSTFKRIVADKDLIQADPNHLKVVVTEELMPYINYQFSAKIVLGKIKASDEQKEAFFEAFRQYLITTYATVFTQYTNQKVIFEPSQDINGKKVVNVKTRIVDGSRPDIHIDFKTRINSKTGEWLVYDMVAEGISLLNSKRAELKGLLRQKDGVVNVTESLLKKATIDISKDNRFGSGSKNNNTPQEEVNDDSEADAEQPADSEKPSPDSANHGG